MIKAKSVIYLCVVALTAMAASACGPSQYHLPPPPQGDQENAPEEAPPPVEQTPTADSVEQPAGQSTEQPAGQSAAQPAGQDDQDRQRYLQARAALLELYQLLSEERFEAAEARLSQQTRDFLAHGNETDDASTALSQGRLALSDGRTREFDPVEFLLGGQIQRITDTVEGAEEHETRRRRELFVITPGGEPHRVVMIVEADRWVLHRTAIEPAAQE